MTEIRNPTSAEDEDNLRNFAARRIIDIPYVADNKSVVFDTRLPQERAGSEEDYGYEYYDDEEEPEEDNYENLSDHP